MGWRRAVRLVLAWSVGPPLVLVAGVLGTSLALLYTPPGRALTTRAVTDMLNARMAGAIAIGGVRGNLLNHVVLEDVAIRDSTGVTMLEAPRVEARYLLPNLLAGRLVFDGVTLERPVIHLIHRGDGRWNYQAIFRSGGDTAGVPSSPPLVSLTDVTIRGATLRVDVASEPGPPKVPISLHGAEPPQPEYVTVDGESRRVYRAADLNAAFPSIRISTPADDPIRVRIARLSTRLSDPAVTIADLRGEVLTAADSLRFEVDHVDLPASRIRGDGAVRWPQDTIRFDFALEAETVSLADLRWIQPDFPAWSGSGRVRALSTSNRHTDYRLDDLTLGAPGTGASGHLVAAVDEDRGFGVFGLDLALRDVSLEVLRPYLDTLPFVGRLDGTLQADGYRDGMHFAGALRFTDAVPPGAPTSDFRIDGNVRFGEEAGATFSGFTLEPGDLDLATVRALVPSVVLPGRLHLVGRLDGPWQDVTFVGTAEHTAPDGALSRLVGTVRMDTRDTTLGLGMDVQFDRLSFDALRSGYPTLTPRGGVSGHFAAEGRLDDLRIDTDLTGDIGNVRAIGTIGVLADGYRFDALALDIQRLDAQALLGGGQPTALSGHLLVSGTIDSAAPPVGRVDLALGQSRIGGFTVDGILGSLRSDGRMLFVDSVRTSWPEGRLLADGTLGWTAPDSGTLRVDAAAASLAPLDSLARASFGIVPDTLVHQSLEGLARVQLAVLGALDDPAIDGTVEAEDVTLDAWHVAALRARIQADSLSRQGIRVTATADSLSHGEYLGRDVSLELGGTADSVTIGVAGELRGATLAAGGWRQVGEDATRFGLDSLQLDLPRQHWRLARPATATIGTGGFALDDTLLVHTTDGSGTIEMTGGSGGAGDQLDVSIVGLELGDLFGIMQRDTGAVGGLASADFRLGGSRDAPTLRGNAMVTGPSFGDAKPPLLRAVYDYRDRRFRTNLAFWKLGDPVLEVDADVPFDLALASRATRTLPGDLRIRATADSAELATLEAFVSSVRSTRGWFTLDLGVSGTWAEPVLQGDMAIHEGRMTIPTLGVRYGPIQGRARFERDSMHVDSLLLSSGEGDLIVKGSVAFEDLSHPVLDLRLDSRNFLAMDVAGFMRLRPTGTVTLTGPLFNAVMRGESVTLNDSDVYFTDLLAKDIINLEDPAFADLVDLEMLRREQLQASFQSRFLDSLRLDNMRFNVGTDVWLRSTGATNIQLEGAVQASKRGREYRVAGELSTPRGDYQLELGGVLNRTFKIDHGTVRYLGTPDLDAELDIQASYNVHAADGEEVPIVANITGTIDVPQVKLSSPGRTIAERDLVSYLLFGRPEFQVASGTGTQGALGRQALESALSVLSGEAGRSIAQSVGLDLFELRPSVSQFGSTTTGGLSLAAGVQLGQRWFVTLNAGFCIGGEAAQSFSARNFGASIEYRFAKDWRLQASAEPVQGCSTTRGSDAFNTISQRYQLGGDLRWSRDY